MALSKVIRRCSSALVPIATRAPVTSRHISCAIPCSRPLTGSLYGVAKACEARHLNQPRCFSTSSTAKSLLNESLERVVKLEIEKLEQVIVSHRCPFKIVEEDGLLKLSRAFTNENEVIELETCQDDLEVDEDSDSDHDENNKDGITGSESKQQLVTIKDEIEMNIIIKKEKAKMELELDVTLCPDEIIIESAELVSFKNKGIRDTTYFSDREENILKCIKLYLETRGVDITLRDTIKKYYSHKKLVDQKERLLQLQTFFKN